MDLKCNLSTIQSQHNLTINYDDLCIEYIRYDLVMRRSLAPTCKTTFTNSWALDLLDTEGVKGTGGPYEDGDQYEYIDIPFKQTELKFMYLIQEYNQIMLNLLKVK